jgi:hypothetical protein
MTPERVNVAINSRLNNAHISTKKKQKKVAAVVGDVSTEISDADLMDIPSESGQGDYMLTKSLKMKTMM